MNDKKNCGLFTDELARTVLNSLSANIAILNQDGVIVETNTAWRNYAIKNGMPESYDFKSKNYLKICDAARGSDAEDAGNLSAVVPFR